MEDVEFGRNLRHTVHPHEIVIPSRPEPRLRGEDGEESAVPAPRIPVRPRSGQALVRDYSP